MTTRRLVLLVLLVFILAGTYLMQRDASLRLVSRQARQEVECRVLVERRDRLQAELERLGGFARLDSVWTSSGRPGAGPALAELARAGDTLGRSGAVIVADAGPQTR
ncbi:MAG: hypothetical protein R6X12_06200 [bacterium]